MENPKIIKIIPYKGLNNEVFEGKKTKISLYTNRLEYNIKYSQKIEVARTDVEDPEIKEVITYTDEEGFITKDNIVVVTKYIETEFKEDLEPHIVHRIDICTGTNTLTLSFEDEAEKLNLYQEIHEWKWGK